MPLVGQVGARVFAVSLLSKVWPDAAKGTERDSGGVRLK